MTRQNFPTVRVYRPLLNASEIQPQSLSFFYPSKNLRLTKQIDPRSLLLSPHETNKAFEAATPFQTTDDTEDLAAHIDSQLPATARKSLKVPALPCGEHIIDQDGRQFRHFALGSLNPIAVAERQTVRDLVHSFFGTMLAPDQPNWRTDELELGIEIGRTQSPRSTEHLRHLLATKHVGPSVLEFAAVVVETV
ncbi:MAG: hypothetical protein ABIV43_01415 [Candidatus Saccharimonadales bacterium]